MLALIVGRVFPSPLRWLGSRLSLRRLVSDLRWQLRLRLRRVLLLGLAAVAWAVSLVTDPTGAEAGPVLPGYGPPVATSQEAAAGFFRKLGRALEGGLATGTVELVISEAEASSALDIGMQLVEIRQALTTMSPAELEALGTPEDLRAAVDATRERRPRGPLRRIVHALDPRLMITESQVRFLGDGRVVVGGYARAWNRSLPVFLEAEPALENGRLVLNVRKTRLGRLPVPAWTLNGPANLLAAILGLGEEYASITAVEVAEGRIRLSARVSRGS